MHKSLCPGEHLFDVDTRKDADWIQEGARFLQAYWPHSHCEVGRKVVIDEKS